MKINITINDLNQAEAKNVINLISGTVASEPKTIVTIEPPVSPVPNGLLVHQGNAEGGLVGQLPPAFAPNQHSNPDTDEDTGETAPMVAGEVDSQGLLWDERIHSSNKKKKADGTWNKRRGVQEKEIAEVEAELRAKLQANFAAGGVALSQTSFTQPEPLVNAAAAAAAYAAATPTMPPLAPVLPLVQSPVAQPLAPVAFVAPVTPVMPVQPAVLPVAAAPEPVAVAPIGRDMSGILTRVQRGVAAGRINGEFINQHIIGVINTNFGLDLKTLVDVSVRADLIEYTHQILDVNKL
jgi:hypothetical protein